MEAEILKSVGQVAGIGGVAIFAFVFIFRDVVRKTIFPTLKKDDAFRLLRLILILTFFVAIAGIGAWIYADRKSRSNTINKITNNTQNNIDLSDNSDRTTINQYNLARPFPTESTIQSIDPNLKRDRATPSVPPEQSRMTFNGRSRYQNILPQQASRSPSFVSSMPHEQSQQQEDTLLQAQFQKLNELRDRGIRTVKSLSNEDGLEVCLSKFKAWKNECMATLKRIDIRLEEYGKATDFVGEFDSTTNTLVSDDLTRLHDNLSMYSAGYSPDKTFNLCRDGFRVSVNSLPAESEITDKISRRR